MKLGTMECFIVVLAIIGMVFIEWYAIRHGINGYGLLAFFATMGGILGYRIKGVKDKLARVLSNKDAKV
jgi:hypothetical protein